MRKHLSAERSSVQRRRASAARIAVVLVSEYAAPDGATVAAEFEHVELLARNRRTCAGRRRSHSTRCRQFGYSPRKFRNRGSRCAMVDGGLKPSSKKMLVGLITAGVMLIGIAVKHLSGESRQQQSLAPPTIINISQVQGGQSQTQQSRPAEQGSPPREAPPSTPRSAEANPSDTITNDKSPPRPTSHAALPVVAEDPPAASPRPLVERHKKIRRQAPATPTQEQPGPVAVITPVVSPPLAPPPRLLKPRVITEDDKVKLGFIDRSLAVSIEYEESDEPGLHLYVQSLIKYLGDRGYHASYGGTTSGKGPGLTIDIYRFWPTPTAMVYVGRAP